MIHFAYPNVKGSQFLGCGRYVALSADSCLDASYRLADPNTGNLSKIMTVASLLAPESFDAKRIVYERKDNPKGEYVGSSLDLAYLLALISRSRSLKWESDPHDIWCSGAIDIVDGRPFLKEVYSDQFSVKLEAFISESNEDRVLIVSAANIHPKHHALLESNRVRVLSLGKLRATAVNDLFESKTILKVNGHEVDLLAGMLFQESMLLSTQDSLSLHPSRATVRFSKDHFDWARVEANMKALESSPVYGDRGYVLKDVYVFQNADFKWSGGLLWEDIGNLRDYLAAFDFSQLRSTRKPMVIYGDFGVGKSSFLKMFASYMVSVKHSYNPIYIPLRDLTVYGDTDLKNALIKYLDTYGVLEPRNLDRYVLLLMDGFDELNLFDTDKNMIRLYFDQLSSLAGYDRIAVIISSRPILFLKEESNILVNTPMLRIREFDTDQMSTWIEKWKTVPEGADSKISVDSLRKRNLLPVVSNPLLLYMTAKIYDSELTHRRAYSKGIIYKLFYDWTIRGKFKSDRQAHLILPNYRQILQNIAMSIRLVGSSEAFIGFEDLRKYILEFQEDTLNEDFFMSEELILVAHFFKVKEKDTLKFIEFAHKSFREYLVAEKVFDFFVHSIKGKEFDDSKWLLLGRHLPEKEELDFLKDLLYSLSDTDLIWLYDVLVRNKSILLIAKGQFRDILDRTRFFRTTEINGIFFRAINLVTLAFIVSNMIYFRLKNRWDQVISEKPLLRDIQPKVGYIYHINHCVPLADGRSYRRNWEIAKGFMSGVNLSKQILDGLDFSSAEIDDVSFVEASLKRCSFKDSRPIFADLSGAVCDGSDFSGAYCNGTKFNNTRLRQVTFRSAQLYYVNFVGTEFVNVDFTDTTFDNCSFQNCSFSNVILDKENVRECVGLLESDFSGALHSPS